MGAGNLHELKRFPGVIFSFLKGEGFRPPGAPTIQGFFHRRKKGRKGPAGRYDARVPLPSHNRRHPITFRLPGNPPWNTKVGKAIVDAHGDAASTRPHVHAQGHESTLHDAQHGCKNTWYRSVSLGSQLLNLRSFFHEVLRRNVRSRHVRQRRWKKF